MYKRNSHCSYCGTAFQEDQPWPRTCQNCGRTTYLNPTPVAVVLLPVGDGLLTVRRNIEPRKGMLALPGGFIMLGESWQEAGAREVLEETGLQVDSNSIEDFRVLSAPDGTLLVFGLAAPLASAELPAFVANEEATEWVVITEPQELAFSLHTQVVQEYFGRKNSRS
jgi:NADH pyrophosphatase NudC (nudix superfamily)